MIYAKQIKPKPVVAGEGEPFFVVQTFGGYSGEVKIPVVEDITITQYRLVLIDRELGTYVQPVFASFLTQGLLVNGAPKYGTFDVLKTDSLSFNWPTIKDWSSTYETVDNIFLRVDYDIS
jgi:hypothetical protein